MPSKTHISREKSPSKRRRSFHDPDLAEHQPGAIIQLARHAHAALTPSHVIQLQRSIGNQAVMRLLAPISKTGTQKIQTIRKRYSTTGAPRSGNIFGGQRNGPFGPWHFHFIKEEGVDSVKLFWVTLENYRGKKRWVLYDHDLKEEDRLGGGLGRQERTDILDWAWDELKYQLQNAEDMPEKEYNETLSVYQQQQEKIKEEDRLREEERLRKAKEAAMASKDPLEAYLAQEGISEPMPRVKFEVKLAKGNLETLAKNLGVTKEQAEQIVFLSSEPHKKIGNQITEEIIRKLIEADEVKMLEFVFRSSLYPLSVWEAGAWSRFLDWNTGVKSL